EQKLDWFGTARGRVGYLVNERTLVFGTAGLAYGETEVSSSFFANANDTFIGASTSIHCPAGAPCLSGQNSNISVGWTAVAGVEWAATNKVTVKFENLHIALPDSQILMSAVAPATGNATVTANFRNQFDLVRAGLNWRF